jgi:hypothetical protein
MPESILGDGLVFEESMPVVWSPGPLAHGLALARLNADNHQLLGAESSLDEVRVHDTLKDESPALLHELQRLEYKLNVLLRLTADLCARNSPLPQPQLIRLSPYGLEWFGSALPVLGSSGLLEVYMTPALPQPLKLPCIVAGERPDGASRVAQLKFVGLSEAVVALIEKLIFRHHRRLVAGTRMQAP